MHTCKPSCTFHFKWTVIVIIDQRLVHGHRPSLGKGENSQFQVYDMRKIFVLLSVLCIFYNVTADCEWSDIWRLRTPLIVTASQPRPFCAGGRRHLYKVHWRLAMRRQRSISPAAAFRRLDSRRFEPPCRSAPTSLFAGFSVSRSIDRFWKPVRFFWRVCSTMNDTSVIKRSRWILWSTSTVARISRTMRQ